MELLRMMIETHLCGGGGGGPGPGDEELIVTRYGVRGTQKEDDDAAAFFLAFAAFFLDNFIDAFDDTAPLTDEFFFSSDTDT